MYSKYGPPKAQPERRRKAINHAADRYESAYTLGLIMPDLTNPFFAEMARYIEERAYEEGFGTIVCSTDNLPERTERSIAMLQHNRVDGVIFATGLVNGEIIAELMATVPVVLLSRDIPTLAIDSVLVDDFLGGRLAVHHLLAKGHRRIAVVAEEKSVTSSTERIRGYRAALEEASMPFRPELVVRIDGYRAEQAAVDVGALLDAHPGITAVFACNDQLAAATIQAANERRIAVPAALSVMGFDNTSRATAVYPPLTTIAQPMREMGRMAVDLLLNKMKEPSSARRKIVMLPELIERSSVSRPLLSVVSEETGT
ncbi:transcriptional regulator [Paenibacillus darwinianus]|uniref:Transcriptional regulator n=1 Tax=Paenibacillus darwinianus TaxID=1380763 RepID=A0A9W5W833_9BACL|nr:substrate-binding domain-containing protein [Paenibacillus darwinianus]EXX90709.1 transcriptional regulator [Paenibacillus darwinianus]EXX91521.1 transcriptional regulator [Paenibacillus darwinianus]EXX92095.1 transcriptional regulator [Paenibacillus darwinianus]